MPRYARLILHAVLLITCAACTSCRRQPDGTARAAPPASTPQRIVSLSPAGTEILWAVGALPQVVVRTDFCDFPPEVAEIPSVGGFSGETLSVETILAYRPDYVYGTAGIHDLLVAPLERAGVPVYVSPATSILAVTAEIERMGVLTGHAGQGAEAAAKVRAVFASVEERTRNASTPRVYYEVWGAPFMSIGSRSYINGIISAAGGANIFADVDDEYPLVSEEAVVARKPDVIIIPDMNGETSGSVSGRPGWSGIPAVQDGRVYFADSNVLSRPGPRITEALAAITQMIHPDADLRDIPYEW